MLSFLGRLAGEFSKKCMYSVGNSAKAVLLKLYFPCELRVVDKKGKDKLLENEFYIEK